MSVDIEDALTEHLLTFTTTGHVAALVSNRIYPDEGPQNPTFPYIVIGQSSESEEMTTNGSSGLPTVSILLEIWGRGDAGKNSVKAIRKALRKKSVLHGYRGLMGTHYVHLAKLQDGRVTTLPPPHGEGRGIIGFALDVSITFEDATPA